MLSLTQSSHNANCLLLTYCGPPTWGRSDKARKHRKYWTGRPRAHRRPRLPVVDDADRYGCCEFRQHECESERSTTYGRVVVRTSSIGLELFQLAGEPLTQ